MNFEELLKAQGLTDEQVSSIVGTMKTNKIYLSNEENIDERYSKLKGQKETLDTELEEANKTIKSLKETNGDNTTLQQTIKDHEATIEKLKTESEAKIQEILFNNTLENALRDNKVKNIKAVQALLDKDAIKLDGDKLEGLEDQIKALRESDSYLFHEDNSSGTGSSGNFGRGNRSTGPTKEDFEKMGYKERVDLYNKDPELYQQLSE